MAKPTDIALLSRRTVTSSSLLLGIVWLVALASVPGVQSYRDQLAAGVETTKIITVYDSLASLVPIAMIAAWIFTTRWLFELYNVAKDSNPAALRLKRPWIIWGWIVPVVSLWFPKLIIEDLLKFRNSEQSNELVGRETLTWWLTWVGFALINNVGIVSAFSAPDDYIPIRPELEIAGACILTASYVIWVRIVKALS
ncbi:MAG: DUF4328 domain-containing protein [Actinomycetes bacterium]